MRHLKERGLTGVWLIISDACLGLVESTGEFYSRGQAAALHGAFLPKWFSVAPKTKTNVTIMRKAIYASEGRKAALEKATLIIEKLQKMKPWEAAEKIQKNIEEA